MKLLIFTGYSHTEIDARRINEIPMGASQYSAICLAKELHALGHDVTVAGDKVAHHIDGVKYYSMNELQQVLNENHYDTILILRYPHFFHYYKYNANRVVVWLQDTSFADNGIGYAIKHQDEINQIVCLTQPHKHLFENQVLPNTPGLTPNLKEKIVYINNGINPSLFPTNVEKVKNRFIWTSRPERGLNRAISIFQEIKTLLPDATFHIASYLDIEPEICKRIEKIAGAKLLGKLNKQQLYEEMAAAEAWLYPTDFFETSCVTAIEMQQSGVVCCTTDVGGLKETVGDRGIIFKPTESNNAIARFIVDSLPNANKFVVAGKIWAAQQTWSNRAKVWEYVLQPKPRPKTNICLNMIVKNETKVLPRLFNSLKDQIDYYVISDTGSTDDTPELIRNLGKIYQIPGKVYHHKWENFGHNRQLALEAAMKDSPSDFALFVDADEELQFSDAKFYEKLDPEKTYEIEKHHSHIRYATPAITNIKKFKWRWNAPVHNFLSCEPPVESGKVEKLDSVWIKYHQHQGAKSAGLTVKEKYLRDANILENELKNNPNDARSQFYLAQSYMDACDCQKAIEHYKKVRSMNGWIEEKYVACWKAGSMMLTYKQDQVEALGLLVFAHELMPTRLEAIFELLKWARINQKYEFGFSMCRGALQLAKPDNCRLFVCPYIYQYAFADELSICAYWSGEYILARDLAINAFYNKHLPEWEKKRIGGNIQSAQKKIDSSRSHV